MPEDYTDFFLPVPDPRLIPNEDAGNSNESGPSEMAIRTILQYGAGLFTFKSSEGTDFRLQMN